MAFKIASEVLAAPSPSTSAPVVEEEEFYSSWSLFLVCTLLILSLLTSYYLQIKRIRAVHETLVSIFAGMFVGLIIRLAPGTMIREMLVSRAVVALLVGGCRALFYGDGCSEYTAFGISCRFPISLAVSTAIDVSSDI